jgi:hypothetical protein
MVSTDLVVHPATGEVVLLDAPTDTLAGTLAAIREAEGEMRTFKQILTGELLRRMDAEATWTVRAGDFTVEGDSPKPKTEYEAEKLYIALSEFVDSGVISQGALEQAVEPVRTYKAKQAGLNKLLALGGLIAETVERHRTEVPRDRRVRIK